MGKWTIKGTIWIIRSSKFVELCHVLYGAPETERQQIVYEPGINFHSVQIVRVETLWKQNGDRIGMAIPDTSGWKLLVACAFDTATVFTCYWIYPKVVQPLVIRPTMRGC